MALFEWNDMFSVGVNSIDDQHKKLIDYVNQLHDAMMEGKANDQIAPILDGLISYTATHFAHEEKYFAQFNYENTDEHKQLHQDLVGQVMDFKGKFDSGEATLSSDLMEFLKEWLMNHIMQEDKKYVECLTSNGAE
jgi:hemerythrin-like metal-binding protein